MNTAMHPDQALFSAERPLPALPLCVHYAGSEKLISKSLALQAERGPLFDVCCDLEDGAAPGNEAEHAEMVAHWIASEANAHGRAGVRIHDVGHHHWQADVDSLLRIAGARVAWITLPKAPDAESLQKQAGYIRDRAAQLGLPKLPPLHVLIETHGALRDVWKIAGMPGVQSLDFGLMDYVSGFQGALPTACLRSPGQFTHPLLARAKAELVSAAYAHAVIPAHNVTLDLKNPQQTFSDARRARDEFGFLRMWSIHPLQINAILDAMAPDFSEIEQAGDLLLAAQAAEWAPIRFAGELQDRASYRHFWSLLKRAHLAGRELAPAVLRAFF